MMKHHNVVFNHNELTYLFEHMNRSRVKKRHRSTTSPIIGTTDMNQIKRSPSKSLLSSIKKKEFVNFFSLGLCLSYEHRLIFSQRSTIHFKITKFINHLLHIEKMKIKKLNFIFDQVDKDGSGMIHANELLVIFLSFLPDSEGYEDNVAKNEPTIKDVKMFMDQLDDNKGKVHHCYYDFYFFYHCYWHYTTIKTDIYFS
jgi:Ca2+-binding EF-hand superfamily protein